jgi:hypothetical protein
MHQPTHFIDDSSRGATGEGGNANPESARCAELSSQPLDSHQFESDPSIRILRAAAAGQSEILPELRQILRQIPCNYGAIADALLAVELLREQAHGLVPDLSTFIQRAEDHFFPQKKDALRLLCFKLGEPGKQESVALVGLLQGSLREHLLAEITKQLSLEEQTYYRLMRPLAQKFMCEELPLRDPQLFVALRQFSYALCGAVNPDQEGSAMVLATVPPKYCELSQVTPKTNSPTSSFDTGDHNRLSLLTDVIEAKSLPHQIHGIPADYLHVLSQAVASLRRFYRSLGVNELPGIWVPGFTDSISTIGHANPELRRATLMESYFQSRPIEHGILAAAHEMVHCFGFIPLDNRTRGFTMSSRCPETYREKTHGSMLLEEMVTTHAELYITAELGLEIYQDWVMVQPVQIPTEPLASGVRAFLSDLENLPPCKPPFPEGLVRQGEEASSVRLTVPFFWTRAPQLWSGQESSKRCSSYSAPYLAMNFLAQELVHDGSPPERSKRFFDSLCVAHTQGRVDEVFTQIEEEIGPEGLQFLEIFPVGVSGLTNSGYYGLTEVLLTLFCRASEVAPDPNERREMRRRLLNTLKELIKADEAESLVPGHPKSRIL